MADKHKGLPATSSLGRKFIGCWMIHILTPPYKHPLWSLGFLALSTVVGGLIHLQVLQTLYPVRAAEQSCWWWQNKVWHSLALCLCHRAAAPLYKLMSSSWVAHEINAFCGCFQWRPLPLVPEKGRNRYRFVTFQTLRLIFPLIILKNRSYLYTLRSITVSPVTNHPPSALSMMWKIVAI